MGCGIINCTDPNIGSTSRPTRWSLYEGKPPSSLALEYITETTSSYESTEHSSVTRSPETPGRRHSLDYATPHRLEMHSSEEPPLPQSSGITPQSSEITPQSEPSVDRILVCDNPTFQSSTPTPLYPDDTNPYQVHRYNFYHIRVGRYLPYFLQLLERLGL